MKALRLAAAALLLVAAASLRAAGPAVPPSPTTYVTDRAGVLPEETRSRLEARLAGFEDETSNQVLVYIEERIPEGTTLEEYATESFAAWKVGQRDRKNGAVLFLFPQDRAARLEVGYGLEGALPDALAGRILNDELFPRLRQGDWGGGVSAAVEAILAATKGEYTGTGRRRGARRERIPWPVLLFIVFFVLPAIFGRRRRRYWYLGGGGFGGGGFGGGWGGGGWGGGGGFSGGGGLSGGGGASGRW